MAWYLVKHEDNFIFTCFPPVHGAMIAQ